MKAGCEIYEWKVYEDSPFDVAHDAYCDGKEILIQRRPCKLNSELYKPFRISRRIVRMQLNWPMETFRLKKWCNELSAALGCELDFYVPV